ncbi:MAG: cell division protein FtsA [Parvularculaceae bacterium]
MVLVRKKKTAKDGDLVAALDIGAAKTACFIASLSTGYDGAVEAEVIGVGHYGAGLRSESNQRLDVAEKAVRAAVDAAERMAGTHIRDVHVAVSGRRLLCTRVCVDLELYGGCVTEEDIGDSLAEGSKIAAPEGVAGLHSLPISFTVDDGDPIVDPRGYCGRQLTTRMLEIGARESALANLSAAIERCGLRPAAFVASPCAAAEAVLIEDEKELGVILIDIGARTTAYAVYDDGALVDCGGVPVGGGHITSDIAQMFGAPLAHAERMKSLNGSALIGAGDDHRFVEFPTLGGGELARISRADLSAVITPRLEEIFELVEAKLPERDAPYNALRRAVLTGGGSLLVGAREVGERVLGVKTRLGRPIALAGAPEAVSAPAFAVCAGMVQYAARRLSDKNGSVGAPAPNDHADGGLFSGVGAWFRAKF